MKGFYDFINEKNKDIIKNLYHGTNSNINSFDTINKLFYLSTDPEFSIFFGNNLYEISIAPKRVFDSRDEENKKKILELYGSDNLKELCNDNFIEKFNSNETWEWLEELINKKHFLDWLLKNNYDCVLITEYGDIHNPTINYIIWDEKLIKNINEIKWENFNIVRPNFHFMNENVKNTKLASYILNDIANKIKTMLDIHNKYDIYNMVKLKSMKLEFDFFDCDFSSEKFKNIEKLLKKYKNKLLNNHILLSYDYSECDLRIYYKEIFVKRINPDDYLYHVTDANNIESIMKYGLIPKSSKESKTWSHKSSLEYLPAIFATSKNNLWSFVDLESTVLLIIDTTKIKNKWYLDANLPNGEYFITYEPISPDAIYIANKFTLLPKV